MRERPPATPAGDARRLARLLRDALQYHRAHGDGHCPVCGCKMALNAAWRSNAESEVDRLSALATEAEERREYFRRPLARDLGAWLASTRETVDRGRSIVDLKKAETWLKSTGSQCVADWLLAGGRLTDRAAPSRSGGSLHAAQ